MAEKGQAASIKDELRQVMRLTTTQAQVTQVINGDTIIINNTETVHLPMIYIPVDNAQSAGEHMQVAKEFLDDTLLNEKISIYQVRNQERGQKNALGHTEGYVVREDGLFVQQEMVAQGLAFAYPSQTHYEIAEMLYTAEKTARQNKLGLWADEKWDIMTDQEAKKAPRDVFAIVEGKIARVATNNNVIYLNFERDWRDDFTISVDSQRRRDFAKYEYNLMQMKGKTVRVRGWMREYNGPYIEIFHPSQLELIDKMTAVYEEENTDAAVSSTPEMIDDTIKERIQPNSPMFGNPTSDKAAY